MSLPPGRRLGPYQVLSPIGAGGMGEVLKARDTRLQRTVAIKVLPSDLASDAERRGRFEREAHAASALNHPNITTVFDIGEDEGTHYIVMELVEGKTLRELLDEGPLPIDRMLPLATQIAEGLAKAHTAGIVHRDLKPENVMVTEDGLVKILDFGLAKLMPQGSGVESEAPTETRATQEGAVLGTVPYMSPEQAASRSLDFRSDQFSFGSILYEMATGKRAFQKDTIPETLAAIIEDDPEPIGKLNETIPVELSAIVAACLAKDPAGRYESTGDLARELNAVREGPSPRHARRRVLWAAAAVVVAVVAVLLGTNAVQLWDQLVRRPGPAPIESIAVLPLRNLSGDPEQEYFADGMTETLITNLTKIGALRVIAPHSAMRYKGSDLTVAEIASELEVDAVVEGSAQRVGESVHIMAQLIDPETEQALWAESYERSLENVLLLQGEVAQAIVAELRVTLSPEQAGSLAAARPVDPEAHDAYLKGSFYWKKGSPEDLGTAQRYFELALERDPDHAPAYAGLAWVWAVRQQFGLVPPHEAGPKGKAAALQAIALDDRSPAAHGALGAIRTWTDFDWEGAEKAWRRALELDSEVANTHAYFAHLLMITGRNKEATRHIERALALDPYNGLFHGLYSVVLEYNRRYDDAVAAARAALAIDPNAPVAPGTLESISVSRGLLDQHLTLLRKRSANDPELVAAFDEGLAEAGYEGAMRHAADLLAARYDEFGSVPPPGLRRSPGPVGIARLYLFAGDHDRAIDWFEEGYQIRGPAMPYLGRPMHDPLRSDPRFQDLLRKMNLPQAGSWAGLSSENPPQVAGTMRAV